VLLALAGCGGDEEESLPEVVAPVPEVEAPEAPDLPEPLYGEDGALLESDVTVAGLVLPRGLEPVLEEERRHVYRSDVPLPRVLQYFGVRLVTGQVDALSGGGATYRDAVPRDVRGGAVHLDVTIEGSSVARTRIEILELAPAPTTPPSEAEMVRRLEQRMREED
jgi:hypothetical protein